MPWAPPRPCLETGCRLYALRSGRCLPHARQHDAERPSVVERYGANWPAKRQRALERDPLCYLCGAEPSAEADHVVPVSNGGSLDDENVRGIGRRCHDEKSARERAARRDLAAPTRMGLASLQKHVFRKPWPREERRDFTPPNVRFGGGA